MISLTNEFTKTAKHTNEIVPANQIAPLEKFKFVV